MKNTLQAYAWGSKTAIAQLMARPFPTQTPEAELWLGAHPKAPSKVWVAQHWLSLDKWISQNPEEILGPQVSAQYKGELPYLFKVLAAAQPLSIQVHPSKAQARIGFENENRLNIPMDATHRNYKDPHHKPECICAITPFLALCGFRKVDRILDIFEALWPPDRKTELAILQNSGLKTFFHHLMTMDKESCKALVEQITQKAATHRVTDPIQQWMLRLQERYPGDVGVLSPGLLNLIQLQPGEAIALTSGQLHAYMDGLGIELMANSDNVIRGGLTPKHVDLPELLKVLDFEPRRPELLKPNDNGSERGIYPSQAEEFQLAVIKSTTQQGYGCNGRLPTPEILLCTQGTAELSWLNGSRKITLPQGESVFVPAMVDQYAINGNATIFKASVNSNSKAEQKSKKE